MKELAERDEYIKVLEDKIVELEVMLDDTRKKLNDKDTMTEFGLQVGNRFYEYLTTVNASVAGRVKEARKEAIETFAEKLMKKVNRIDVGDDLYYKVVHLEDIEEVLKEMRTVKVKWLGDFTKLSSSS